MREKILDKMGDEMKLLHTKRRILRILTERDERYKHDFRPRHLLREDLEYYQDLTSEAVDKALEELEEEDLIQVEKRNGVVVIEPTEKGLKEMKEIQEKYKERLRKLRRRFGFRGGKE